MLRSLQEGFPSQVFKAKPDQIQKHKREISLPITAGRFSKPGI